MIVMVRRRRGIGLPAGDASLASLHPELTPEREESVNVE
jgi:hypothetical protein